MEIPVLYIEFKLDKDETKVLNTIVNDGINLCKRTDNEELMQVIYNIQKNMIIRNSKLAIKIHVYEIEYLLQLINLYIEKYSYEDNKEYVQILNTLSEKVYEYYKEYNNDYIEPFWKNNDTNKRIGILKKCIR